MTYIIDAVRTPIGNFGGTLKEVRTDDLGAITIRELVKRTGIDASKIDNSKVFILSTVRIRNQKNGTEVTYTLVAENEADLKFKKISIDSPIARGLLGRVVGDIAEVNTPAGVAEFEILEITR